MMKRIERWKDALCLVAPAIRASQVRLVSRAWTAGTQNGTCSNPLFYDEFPDRGICVGACAPVYSSCDFVALPDP
jgi:hypothetical protein